MSKKAVKAAVDLLSQCGITSFPVPVDQIARGLNARIAYQPMKGDISGMLYRDGDRVVIGVNSGHAVTRQRFTVAHELGHLRLHEGRPMIIDHLFRVKINMRDGRSSLATDAEEIEANGFAAELLMPRASVRERVVRSLSRHRQVSEGAIISELARYYNVSTEAMDYRLINLGLRTQS
jgi:Zn-dependent peptidase ImmA (M78 family)